MLVSWEHMRLQLDTLERADIIRYKWAAVCLLGKHAATAEPPLETAETLGTCEQLFNTWEHMLLQLDTLETAQIMINKIVGQLISPDFI
jgi:hypothetical protein